MTSIRTTRFPRKRKAGILESLKKEAAVLVNTNRTLQGLAAIPSRISATASAFATWISTVLLKPTGEQWFTLDEHLLTDIGKTSIEAELEWLRARWEQRPAWEWTHSHDADSRLSRR